MVMMRPDMVFKLSSHSAKSLGSLRTVAAIRAPYRGGLEISDLWRMANWEPMREMVVLASGPGLVTKWKHPARSP